MNMIIKTDFGEFNFNLDNKSAQDVVNLALNKAVNCEAVKGKNTVVTAEEPPAPAEHAPTTATEPLNKLVNRVSEDINNGMTNVANALVKATTRTEPAAPKPKRRAETMFGDRAGWSMPAADNKKNPKKEESYTGFMHIKCEKCGFVKTFYSKYNLTYFNCHECGEHSELIDLRPAHARCGCGAYQTYRTNETDAEIKIPCKACRVPTRLILNKAGTTYVMPNPWDNEEQSNAQE